MYFKGTLTVDPQQISNIEVIKPEGGFRQLFYSITGGKVGDKKEVETFKAVSIIQQMYVAFQAMGINNIIRLNHDDIEIYYDEEGRKDDFRFATDKYSIEIGDAMSSYFNTLWLVLEYEDDNFKYLIEISINRSHEVHTYPIEILVSGLLKSEASASKDNLKQKMGNVFNSQEDFDRYLQSRQMSFNTFLDSMVFELKKHIRIDDIKQQTKTRMIIPKEKRKKEHETSRPAYGQGPFEYYGFGDFLIFSLFWSELCFDSGMHIANTELIDEAGGHLTDIGESGIDAVEGSVFDDNMDVDEALNSMDTENLASFDDDPIREMDMEDTDSGGWFDSIGEGFDTDFDF